MKLEEFLKCDHDHDIDMNTSMTRLYCAKCGQDANVITYCESLKSQLAKAIEVIKLLKDYGDMYEEKRAREFLATIKEKE